jgi:hypothetical protein
MTEKQAEPGHPLRDEAPLPLVGVKRPLAPVVLALMLGLAVAAWGLQVPGIWLAAGLAGLLAVLVLLYGFGLVRYAQEKDRDGPVEPTEAGRDPNSRS